MLGKYKLGATLPAFGSCADRYCLSGYGRGGTTVEEMLDLATQVKNLDGLELVSNWHVNDKNINYVAKLFKERNLKICMLVPDLWTQKKWGRGSITSKEPDIRKEAIKEIKKTIDWAYELGCVYIDVWPGQDGYDYSFQADFIESWKMLKDAISEVASYNKKVKVLVEYKLKEPRTHCFVGNAPKTILLLQNIKNVGCLLDVGHSLSAGENIAEAASLLSTYGLLDYIHLNDNYRTWDDDMMVASVHIVEYFEFIYWLKRLNYTGWLTLDIFPYREEKVPAVKNCFEWLKVLFSSVERVGVDYISSIVEKGDANESLKLVRKILIG